MNTETPKILMNRFSGNKCRGCHTPQHKGVMVYWHGKGHGITCVSCHILQQDNLKGAFQNYDHNHKESEEKNMSESTFLRVLGPDPDAVDYALQSVDELRKLCRERGLQGTTLLSLSKAQLVEFLETGSYTTKDTHKTAEPQVNAATSASAIEQAIRQIAESVTPKNIDAVSEERVNALLDARLKDLSMPQAITVTLKASETAEPKDLGLQHKSFPLLLTVCSSRTKAGDTLNVWLAGPAGSGKTTAAQYVAKALDLQFYFTGALNEPWGLLGFKDATGNYNRTQFREAYEHGGVFLFDEIDGSGPDALLCFNAALANGHCAFPDKVVPRHKDCIILAAANTHGLGARGEYVGRMKQDGAFLDRFVYLDWPVDEALELETSGNRSWTLRVIKVRQLLAEKGIKVLVTPRASIYGASLLESGLDVEAVAELTIRKGMTNDQWNLVRGVV